MFVCLLPVEMRKYKKKKEETKNQESRLKKGTFYYEKENKNKGKMFIAKMDKNYISKIWTMQVYIYCFMFIYLRRFMYAGYT